MKYFLSFLSILIFAYACTPSKSMINYSDQDQLNNFNEIVENKKNKIYLLDGKIIYPEKLTLQDDSLFYEDEDEAYALPVSEVDYVRSTNKPRATMVLGLPLFVAGIITIGAKKINEKEHVSLGDALGDAYEISLGVVSTLSGFFLMVIGKGLESEIYKFERVDLQQIESGNQRKN